MLFIDNLSGEEQMPLNPTRHATDILVVGSGSAGAMAAIKAQMAGADVLVATKGPYPSGNSTKAMAGYAAAALAHGLSLQPLNLIKRESRCMYFVFLLLRK